MQGIYVAMLCIVHLLFAYFGSMGRHPTKNNQNYLGQEMALAVEASDRLIGSLQRLLSLVTGPLAASRKRHDRLRHDAALQAIGRHARTTLSEFAFIDGLEVKFAHPGLLTVFYADPMNCVASRYCWALLKVGHGAPPTLRSIIEATQVEHHEFVRWHGQAASAEPTEGELNDLLIREGELQKRADRLGYAISVLRRRLLCVRHMEGASQVSQIERVLSPLDETADAVFSELRAVQLQRLRASRDS